MSNDSAVVLVRGVDDTRVIEIYARSGVEYLGEIRKEFPAGVPTLDSAQLLNKV